VPERLGPTGSGPPTLQPRLSQPSQPLSPARHARCGEPPLESAPGMRSAARPGQQAGPVWARIRMGNKWAHSARVPGRTRFRRARAGLRHPSSMQSQASSSAGSASGQAPPAVTWCVEGGMVRTAANRTRYPEARRSWEPDRPRGSPGHGWRLLMGSEGTDEPSDKPRLLGRGTAARAAWRRGPAARSMCRAPEAAPTNGVTAVHTGRRRLRRQAPPG
jgi:hypothetical protein